MLSMDTLGLVIPDGWNIVVLQACRKSHVRKMEASSLPASPQLLQGHPTPCLGPHPLCSSPVSSSVGTETCSSLGSDDNESMLKGPSVGCLKKGLAESQDVIIAGPYMHPAQVLIVHKSFSEQGSSNPYKENDFSCQELISS